MNLKDKILKLVVRFLFLVYFALWSFFTASILQTESSNKLLQDNEAYLTPSEYNFSISDAAEEISRSSYHSDSYLGSSSNGLFGLPADHHDIKSGKPLILNNKYIYFKYTRPPPVPCPFFI